MIYNDRDIIRRLERVERHIDECDSRKSQIQVMETKLTEEVKAIAKFLSEHMEREEEEARKSTDVQRAIADKLNTIEKDLVTQPKDVQIQLGKQMEEVKYFCNENFASRHDLNSGLNSIRQQAKYIWYTLCASAAFIAWIIANKHLLI